MGIYVPGVETVTRRLAIESGVTLAKGDSVVPSSTAGRCTKGDARYATVNVDRGIYGICLVGGTGDAGGTVYATIVTYGPIDYSSWSLTAGSPVFMSTSAAGTVTNTVPSGRDNRRVWIGFSPTTTRVFVQPMEPIIL